jgi:hypothetical protein
LVAVARVVAVCHDTLKVHAQKVIKCMKGKRWSNMERCAGVVMPEKVFSVLDMLFGGNSESWRYPRRPEDNQNAS